jgi:hypothetical protein
MCGDFLMLAQSLELIFLKGLHLRSIDKEEKSYWHTHNRIIVVELFSMNR